MAFSNGPEKSVRPEYEYETAAREWSQARDRRDRAREEFKRADDACREAEEVEVVAWNRLVSQAGRDGAPGPVVPIARGASPRWDPPPAPRGFAHLRFLLILAFVIIGVFVTAGMARADNAGPDVQGGACFAEWCVGPRVAAPAMAVELKTGDVTLGFQPGFGYGIERNGKVPMGLAAFVSLRETSSGQRVCPALLFSFARYIHTGPAFQTGPAPERKWFWLLTLGTDLGIAR